MEETLSFGQFSDGKDFTVSDSEEPGYDSSRGQTNSSPGIKASQMGI